MRRLGQVKLVGGGDVFALVVAVVVARIVPVAGSGRVGGTGAEVAEPAGGVGGVGAAEEHQRPVGSGGGWQVGLTLPIAARDGWGEQRPGTLGRPGGVAALDGDRCDRGVAAMPLGGV